MQKEKLLMIPGPSPVHPRILNSLSQPTISHVSPEMVEELREGLSALKKIVFCEKGEPFVVCGSGTLAMEMALLNTIEKGEKILILSQGFFGQRMAQIARSFSLDCDLIESEWGKAVLPEEMEKKISEREYKAVVSTHVDTCTGACAPIKDYADILKKHDLIFIVDGVCATGGIEERMDDWKIDVILTAAQKCLGAPPGLSILIVSEKAMEKRRRMKEISAYYSDLLNWLPVMRDPSKYFSTPAVNEIRAFYESTKIVLEEGMEQRFSRHARVARGIRAALTELGFSFFTQEPFLADTLTVINYPQGIEDKAFRSKFYEKGVVVAGGLGETSGRVFRMGHMGNLSLSQVYFALDSLERTLSSLGYKFKDGSSLQAAKEILE